MAQTSRQIFNSQMHFHNFERCFFMEDDFTGETFQKWPVFRDNGITNRRAALDWFGMDVLFNAWGYDIESPTFLLPWFEREIISETENTVIVRGGYGALEEKFKDGRDGGRMFQPVVVTPEDWARVKGERFVVGDPRREMNISQIKNRIQYREDMPFALFIGSLIGMSRLMLTFEEAVYACYDYPEMIEDMVETNCQLIERYLEQMLPHFPTDIAFVYENITCRNGPTIPVWVVRDIVAPRLKRVCDKLKSFGIGLISVGSDGDVRPLLPIFLDCGVNCLSPCEAGPGGVRPGVLLDEYRGALRILGAVDKHIFHRGKEAIDAYLSSIASYVRRGGFIPHVDHTVYPEMGQENYLYYLCKLKNILDL